MIFFNMPSRFAKSLPSQKLKKNHVFFSVFFMFHLCSSLGCSEQMGHSWQHVLVCCPHKLKAIRMIVSIFFYHAISFAPFFFHQLRSGVVFSLHVWSSTFIASIRPRGCAAICLGLLVFVIVMLASIKASKILKTNTGWEIFVCFVWWYAEQKWLILRFVCDFRCVFFPLCCVLRKIRHIRPFSKQWRQQKFQKWRW